MRWEELENASAEAASKYARASEQAADVLVQRLGGSCVLAIPDLGSLHDVLSSLRQVNNLLIDTLDQPERIHAAIQPLENMHRHYWRLFWSKFKTPNGGLCAECMRVLSNGPTHISSCDFSAMIGPDMFQEFILPVVQRECRDFSGKVLFHMDGPGQMPHLQSLLSLPDLRAIQWVPGAGAPDVFSKQWDDLYRQILDAGKNICLGGGTNDPEVLKAFFKKWPKRAFFIPVIARDAENARELAALA